jgi:hypothetical protein
MKDKLNPLYIEDSPKRAFIEKVTNQVLDEAIEKIEQLRKVGDFEEGYPVEETINILKGMKRE